MLLYAQDIQHPHSLVSGVWQKKVGPAVSDAELGELLSIDHVDRFSAGAPWSYASAPVAGQYTGRQTDEAAN